MVKVYVDVELIQKFVREFIIMTVFCMSAHMIIQLERLEYWATKKNQTADFRKSGHTLQTEIIHNHLMNSLQFVKELGKYCSGIIKYSLG